MEPELEKKLTELREASSKEHGELKIMIEEIKTDLRGDESRGIDGVIPTLKKHDRVLQPFIYLYSHPKVAVGLLVLIIEGLLEVTRGGGLVSLFISYLK